MAELNTDCCAPTAKQTCCEPDEKASCCGEQHAPVAAVPLAPSR